MTNSKIFRCTVRREFVVPRPSSHPLYLMRNSKIGKPNESITAVRFFDRSVLLVVSTGLTSLASIHVSHQSSFQIRLCCDL